MTKKRAPQHINMFSTSSLLNWDWRRENPVELVLLVFVLCAFFFLPRAGCGISSSATQTQAPVIEALVPGDQSAPATTP